MSNEDSNLGLNKTIRGLFTWYGHLLNLQVNVEWGVVFGFWGPRLQTQTASQVGKLLGVQFSNVPNQHLIKHRHTLRKDDEKILFLSSVLFSPQHHQFWSDWSLTQLVNNKLRVIYTAVLYTAFITHTFLLKAYEPYISNFLFLYLIRYSRKTNFL